jgi:hypothetical protein
MPVVLVGLSLVGLSLVGLSLVAVLDVLDVPSLVLPLALVVIPNSVEPLDEPSLPVEPGPPLAG